MEREEKANIVESVKSKSGTLLGRLSGYELECLQEVDKLAAQDFYKCLDALNPHQEDGAWLGIRICAGKLPILHASVVEIKTGLVFKRVVKVVVLVRDEKIKEFNTAMTIADLMQVLGRHGIEWKMRDAIRWFAVCDYNDTCANDCGEDKLGKVYTNYNIGGVRGDLSNKAVVLDAQDRLFS